MLEYNEVAPKKMIVLDNEPYLVLSSAISKKSRQQASNQTKLKNLITGKVTSRAFHQSDKLVEADIGTRKTIYLYNSQGEWWFCDADNPRNRFFLPQASIGKSGQFLKENTLVETLTFNNKVIGIRLPAKINLIVAEAPPSIRGNTIQGGTKQVMLENGAQVNVPLFIEQGDTIRVNTETGRYSERVGKK